MAARSSAVCCRTPTCAGARQIAEKFRQAVLDLGVPHEGAQTGAVVSISQGIAVLAAASHALTPDLLIKNADIALYEAKTAGRNCFRHREMSLEFAVDQMHMLRRPQGGG